MILELNEKEAEVLKLVLKSFDAELRGEIGKTDDPQFRAALHGDEDIVRRLLDKVSLQKVG